MRLERRASFYGDQHVASLTGLRGVGAMLVVIYHFHQANMGPLQPVFEVGGAVGVMMFFSLSGYILAYLYGTKFPGAMFGRAYVDFIWKRVARIYPLHVFLLFLLLLIYPKFTSVANSGPPQVLTNLTLTQAWSFDLFSFVEPSWSVSIEFFYYLIFPVLVLLARPWLSTLTFVLLAALAGIVAAQMVPMDPRWLPYLNHRIFSYGIYFVLGASLFYMAKYRIVRAALDHDGAFCLLVAALIAISYTYQPKLFLLSFIVPLLIRPAHTAPIAGWLLGNRPMIWLGEMSYVLYLSHDLMHQIIISVGRGQPIDPIAEWGSTYLLLLIWCPCCHYLIEIPARETLRGLWTWREPAAITPKKVRIVA